MDVYSPEFQAQLDQIIAACKEQGALPHQFSPDAINALYTFGYAAYESGKFETAMHFFRLLILIDAHTKRNWFGLGVSYQMLKEYNQALQCYAYTALLDENDPFVHFHAAECFFSLNKIADGLNALREARAVADQDGERYSRLIEKIEILKDINEKNHTIRVK